MKGCLSQQDIDAFMAGSLSARKTSAAGRHLSECRKCATALAEAEANEEYLRRLGDADDLAEVRRKIAESTAPETATTIGLTGVPSER